MARIARGRERASSLTDHASVRGVKQGRPNRKRRQALRLPRPSRAGVVGFLKWTVLSAAIVGLGYGAVRFWELAHTSPKLAITEIEVLGTHRAERDAVAKLSGLVEGQNILSISPDDVERTIEAHPWVKHATVSRRLPTKVKIEVVEHVPVVLVALGHLYYANAEGEIVKRYTPGEQEVLPVVTGLGRAEVEAEDAETKRRLVGAIQFLAELKETLGAQAPEIAELHLEAASGLSFVTRDDEATVVVGQAPYRVSLERWMRVREALAEKGVRAARITVGGERRPDRVVAKLVSDPEAPAPDKATSKPRGERPKGERKRAEHAKKIDDGSGTLVSLGER